MRIDLGQEPDYETVAVESVGFVDPYAVEGMVTLRSDWGGEFHMRAFSGEVARHIMGFLGGGGGGGGDSGGGSAQLPTVYRMIEEICEHGGMLLVKVKIYESGQALRANLYLTGRGGDLVLRSYRASDALALAVYYRIPILVRKGLLRESVEA